MTFIISATIITLGLVALGVIVRQGLIDAIDRFGMGEQAEYVNLEKVMAEQYPEQYSTLPEDLLFEEDFTLLD
jgi:hypothetical protein